MILYAFEGILNKAIETCSILLGYFDDDINCRPLLTPVEFIIPSERSFSVKMSLGEQYPCKENG